MSPHQVSSCQASQCQVSPPQMSPYQLTQCQVSPGQASPCPTSPSWVLPSQAEPPRPPPAPGVAQARGQQCHQRVVGNPRGWPGDTAAMGWAQPGDTVPSLPCPQGHHRTTHGRTCVVAPSDHV